MEVSLLKVSSNLIEKPVLSNSNHSPITRASEVVLAEQESDKCKHFTIRGFVSEARKRNAKNCWPFPMVNHTLDEHVDVLPPLPVKFFRRWSCQGCLHESIAPETFIPNGANMTNQNDAVKNKHSLLIGDATEVSHRGTTKLLVRFPHKSKENNLERIIVQEHNSPCISSDGRCTLLYCGKKHDASPTSDLIKEGISIAKGGYNQSKENQNLRSKTNAVRAEEAYQTGEKREGNIMVRANISEISFLSEDSPKSFSKWDKTALIQPTGGSRNSDQIRGSLSFTVAVSDRERDQRLRKIGKRKELNSHVPEHRIPQGVDVTIPEDGAFPAPLIQIHRHDSKDLDECGDEASDTSMPLIRSLLPSQDDVRKPGITVEKSHPKKSRKMRTLDDIMKSSEIQYDEKNCSSDENAGVSDSGRMETPDASKQKDEETNHKCHLIQNTEPTLINSKTRKEAVANDGEGSCLIHWLKKVPRKTGLHKREGEARHINTVARTPKLTAVKGLDLNLEYSGRGENKQQIIGEKKQNMIPEVEVVKSTFMPQEDRRAQKSHLITKDLQTDNLHPKSSGIIISENELHHKIDTHDNIPKETPLSNKKNKRPLVEDETSGTQQLYKGSLGFQKEAAFQVHREVKEKQKTMRMSEPEAGEDIPMDIVELLAKKLQERHLTNTAHMSRLSQSTGNRNNCNGREDTAGAHGSRVSDVNRCLYQQEPQCNVTRYDAGTSVRINGDAECRLKPYHSCSRDKQYHHFDLNQEAPICSSAELQAPSPYIGLSVNGAQLSIVDSNRNYSPQIWSTNGMKMLDFCSNHMGQTAAPQNLFSNNHDGSCGLLNGYPPQVNAHNVFSDFISHDICLGANLKTVAHNNAYRIMVNPAIDKAESSPSGGIPAAESFAESRNGYYSNMVWPVGVHEYESVSALNLLRLRHHSACSGEVFHSSSHKDNMRYNQASNGHGSELLRSEVDGIDPRRPSGASGNWELGKREENLCKPLRPLPRFGILGPLLQKEITNTSSNSTLTLGFGARNPEELTFCKSSFTARHSHGLTSHKTIEKGKAEASLLVPPLTPDMKDMNAKTSMSRYGVSGRIDSSVSSLANPGCTLPNDNIGQVVTGSRDGAFQPIRSSCKMEECVVNRNPADFTMPDDDSEYMIGYQETKTKDMPCSGSLLSRTHLHSQKGQKMRKLDDLNHYRTSKKSSLSRFSCPQKAM